MGEKIVVDKTAATTVDLSVGEKEQIFRNEERQRWAAELVLANVELVLQNEEKERSAAELVVANKELLFQNEEKEKRAAELIIANKELVFQNEEKGKRAAELILANKELIFQNKEKEKRAAELIIANKELVFQNEEKEKRAAELIIANKELVFQNQEKGKRAAELVIANSELLTFNYITSHDLHEPLRRIATFASLILDKERRNLSDSGKNYFGRIIESTIRMRQLLDDILAYSRVNNIERKFEEADLNPILANVEEELKDLINEKHATIDASEICPVRIIPFQFHQLMNNLISNSLKFARPGIAPHIVIRSRIVKGGHTDIEKLEPEKEYCHISVEDNGIGFEPQYSEQIFTVFQKLHHRDKYPGTGIGLAIVKKIIENHDGVIIATGKPNEGTRFDIYLPAA